MKIEMKQCPFCGGKAEMTYNGHGLFWVECGGCHCSGRLSDTEQKAIEVWNRRSDTTELDKSSMMICEIRELAEYYSSIICKGEEFCRDIPDCDFAIAEIPGKYATLEEIKASSSGWYGMKRIDAGFDSEELCVITDYYGGGCANFAQLCDAMEKKEITESFIHTILHTLNTIEAANRNTAVIVDFKTEKGATSNV